MFKTGYKITILVLLSMLTLVSRPALAVETYRLAVIDVPMTCNSYVMYQVPRDGMPRQTAVALYQLIRFAFATEEITDKGNSLYRAQFGYNPSAIRFNHENSLHTIIPLTVTEMQKTLHDNPAIMLRLQPAVQRILDFRTTHPDPFAEPEEFFATARDLLQPIVESYHITVTEGDGLC